MLHIKTKTLSLTYNPTEDRMKLVINKDEKDQIAFWITRRFYFSLLFELETLLEQLNISQQKPMKNKQKGKAGQSRRIKTGSNDTVSLVQNINIKFIKDKMKFIFLFQSNTIEAETVFGIKEFLTFQNMLKTALPKGEWGII